MLEMKDAVSTSAARSALRRYAQWWPVLLGFAAMLLVYIAALFNQQELLSRRPNEDIALVLLGICVGGFLLQTVIFHSQFHLFMAILCAALFCREWHFLGSSAALYITLGLLAFWAVKRKEVFGRIFAQNRLKIWISATLATYVLSQFIARRVFRSLHLPQETQLHIHLEETVETMGHLMMIVICILGWKVGSAMVKSADSDKV